ncbi:putative ribonuclease H-like domain-containing protein [Tanacetum coccineum]
MIRLLLWEIGRLPTWQRLNFGGNYSGGGGRSYAGGNATVCSLGGVEACALTRRKNCYWDKIVLRIKENARVLKEAIRLFLSKLLHNMGFMVYQMDVKSAFLYGEIDEEVYVTQPKVFEDPFYPKHVYKVVKALYGLDQAPQAWYARLSTFLLKHNYRRGSIDKTLFIKKNSRDIILVQVYVDGIIFGSTNKAWCDEFEVLMKGEFEMSAMGELTFFLGLQVTQKSNGIFISQDKYVQDMLKKFDMVNVRSATTPFEATIPKSKEEPDEAVNVHLYRSMIGSLMYLTASRPDIQFAVSACSRHQVTPLTSHLNAVKRIFKYLKGRPKLGLWYPRDSPFVLEAYSDSDYAGSHGDRKSTTGGCQFLGRRLISWQCKKQTIVATSSTEAEYVLACKLLWDRVVPYVLLKTSLSLKEQSDIEIRHHFIRDANEKHLIQVLKIHTDDNMADLLTKAFDGPRFNHLVLFYPHHPYFSPIKQFWSTASLLSSESGPPAIVATIDGTPYTITESLVRSSLLLDDAGGIVDMTIAEIYTGMDNLGYPTEGKLTIHKNKFSPQWRLNFHGDPMPLLASMLAPAQPAIAGESSGEAEPSVPPNVPETVTETVHSHDQVSTPPRPAPTNTDAQVNEQGPFSDPNFESTSTQAHDSIPDPVPSTNVEDESLGGTFFATPPRSPAAPPKGTTSRGAADPLNLTALCTLVCEQGKKIENLESELQAHKLLFKEVMGKLVKRVKFLESKLKARRRNVFVSESDDEEAEEHDVDPLIKLAKAAASAADTSPIPANDNQKADIPPGASTHTTAFGSDTDVPTGPSFGFSADPFNKGKSPMVEEDPPIKQRSFRQLEVKRSDRMLEAAYKSMGAVKFIWLNVRRQFETQRFIEKRNKPMTYAQQKNFMRTYVKNQSSVIYSTGWTLKHVKSFSDATLQEEFNKIRHAVENLQTQILRRSIKRPGADLDKPTSKKSKSNEAQHTSVPSESNPSTAGVPSNPSPFVDTPPHSPEFTPVSPPKPSDAAPSVAASHTEVPPAVPRTTGPRTRSKSIDADIKTYTTRRKSLAPRKMPSSEVDLNAPDKSFIHVLSDDDSDDSAGDTNPPYWHAFAAWEIVPTGLGDVNVLYFTDKSTKFFTHLREILHLLDRQDLSKLYGMVVKHYEVNPLAGNGLLLWGDLHVLFDSTSGGSSVEVWNDQKEWVIYRWKLFPFSGVHMLETFAGKILYMFADTPYPLSASLMKKMLKHKLEVEIDGIGNDMTYAVQLIQFIKNQLASCHSSA